MKLNVLRKWEFFFSLHHFLEYSFFYENWSNIRSKTWLIKLQKIVGNFSDKLRKLVPEWNAHLEIFSRIQAIENSWQSCFFEQIFYRKQSLGAPAIWPQRQGKCNANLYSGRRNLLSLFPQSFLKLPEEEKKVIYLMSKSKKWLLNYPSQRVKMTQNENNIKQNEKWIIHHKI